MHVELTQQQTQKLSMTTEMKQAISILRYSAADLADYIQKEALENPLIEIEQPAVDFAEYRYKEPMNNPFDFIGSQQETLPDYLLEQLSLRSFSKAEEQAIHYIIFH
ncbi:RNA polymerase factor sigma-54 [Virgibacillus senegalensis]|uniref:hypothetical protein n=1 Tax=Virgibacillus senegalensis TaxID=1499679 RepID=UPI00069ECA40|nr:hypothetical protein [Virgibacillus senegalensis]